MAPCAIAVPVLSRHVRNNVDKNTSGYTACVVQKILFWVVHVR